MIDQLLHDPLTYIVALALWLGKLYLERRVPASVDQRFAERLEAHKQALDVLTERSRFDLQRQLADFNLFVERKHSAAAKVWEACRIAHGYASGLFGFSTDYTFEEFNQSDIQAHMDAHQVPKGKQTEVIALWDSARPKALAVLRPYLRMLRIQEADRKFREAKNVVYLNELYFPDSIIGALNAFFEQVSTWITLAEYPPQPGEQVAPPDRKALNAAMSTLHEALRTYVSSGALSDSATLPVKRVE